MFRKTSLILVTAIIVALAATVTAVVSKAQSHEEKFERRTAIISEEVVRQKLATLGIEKVVSVKKTDAEEPTYVIQAELKGKIVDVSIDGVSGAIITTKNDSVNITDATAPELVAPGTLDRAQVTITQAQMVAPDILAAVPKDSVLMSQQP